MDRQGFDPLAQTFNQVIAFMERIEESEDPQMIDKKPAAKKVAKSPWKENGKKQGGKYCLLHGTGGHSTDECRHLQQQAKKLKDSHSPDKTGSGPNKFGNKSWSRKSAEAKASSSKELNAFIKKAIARGVAKELNNAERKRKAADSSDEEGEINMVDLSEFNYEDMEKLRIKDDGSISI